MKKYFLVLASVLVYTSVFSQRIIPCIEASPNITHVGFNSPFSLYGAKQMNPGFGFHAGGNVRIGLGYKVFIKTGVVYNQKNVFEKDSIRLYDNTGNLMKKVKGPRISNNYLTSHILFFFSSKDRIHFGAGINVHYLVYSKSIIKDFKQNEFYLNNGQAAPYTYKNNYYKKAFISIPFQIMVDIKKVYFFSQYDLGISSRIKSSARFNEIEQVFMIGAGLSLKGKRQDKPFEND